MLVIVGMLIHVRTFPPVQLIPKLIFVCYVISTQQVNSKNIRLCGPVLIYKGQSGKC